MKHLFIALKSKEDGLLKLSKISKMSKHYKLMV